MPRPPALALACCWLFLAAACRADPQSPSAQDNRQLDEADRLLNEAPASLEAVGDAGLSAQEAEPEPPQR